MEYIVEKEEGMPQKMMIFSRHGKATVNMYRAFHKKPKSNVVSTLSQK